MQRKTIYSNKKYKHIERLNKNRQSLEVNFITKVNKIIACLNEYIE